MVKGIWKQATLVGVVLVLALAVLVGGCTEKETPTPAPVTKQEITVVCSDEFKGLSPRAFSGSWGAPNVLVYESLADFENDYRKKFLSWQNRGRCPLMERNGHFI